MRRRQTATLNCWSGPFFVFLFALGESSANETSALCVRSVLIEGLKIQNRCLFSLQHALWKFNLPVAGHNFPDWASDNWPYHSMTLDCLMSPTARRLLLPPTPTVLGNEAACPPQVKGMAVSSHDFNSHNFKSRVSSPTQIAYFHFKLFFGLKVQISQGLGSFSRSSFWHPAVGQSCAVQQAWCGRWHAAWTSEA